MATAHPIRPARRIQLLAKRTLDLVAAATILIFLSPLFLLTLLAIKLDSRGPVFSRVRQPCYGNRALELITFRCSDTVIGASLHRSGLDKLPMWINVLRGDMSVIGPRCEAALSFPDQISLGEFPFKPGIVTPQAAHTSHASGAGRVDPDLFYISNWSLLLDLRIFVLSLFSATSYIDKI